MLVKDVGERAEVNVLNKEGGRSSRRLRTGYLRCCTSN